MRVSTMHGANIQLDEHVWEYIGDLQTNTSVLKDSEAANNM